MQHPPDVSHGQTGVFHCQCRVTSEQRLGGAFSDRAVASDRGTNQANSQTGVGRELLTCRQIATPMTTAAAMAYPMVLTGGARATA